jgi:hypothetical protein
MTTSITAAIQAAATWSFGVLGKGLVGKAFVPAFGFLAKRRSSNFPQVSGQPPFLSSLGKASALDIRFSRRLKPQCNENKILVTLRITV